MEGSSIRQHVHGALLLTALLMPAAGCAGPEGTPREAMSAARSIGELAATPEQARLWKEAAEKNAAAGLERIPLVQRPVAPHQRMVLPDRKVERIAGLPKGPLAALRLVEAPELPGEAFAGSAVVAALEGERLRLDLGQGRVLAAEVRVRGGALATRAGDKAEVEYRTSDDPFARRALFALRTGTGDIFLSLLEGGKGPVMVRVPLLGLIASQVAVPGERSPAVDVRVGDATQRLTQGKTASFTLAGQEKLVVALLASSAAAGADAHRAEGHPFAIHLQAWREQP